MRIRSLVLRRQTDMPPIHTAVDLVWGLGAGLWIGCASSTGSRFHPLCMNKSSRENLIIIVNLISGRPWS